MRHARLACLAICGLLIGLVPCQADVVASGRFSVNPTLVVFSDKATSALLSLTNEGQEPMRFQLGAFGWSQAPDGEMQLWPTEDIVFFPQILALAPGESRNIRVAVLADVGASERAYRLFIEQLPPSEAERKPGIVHVLTRVGIPIFLEPASVVRRGELQDVTVAEDSLRFAVANTGTVHFVPQSVTVRGVTATGSVVFEHRVPSWYVLAGHTSTFQVALKDLPRGEAEAYVVQLDANDTRVESRVPRARAVQHAGRTVR
ncbi:MAG TPA: fimbria/pilus periplasmic chaperone [Vicinamibacterales bacterium]|nr:fimbria/pilus periplasmic chaperone [Vicinamibacterales bacterium]